MNPVNSPSDSEFLEPVYQKRLKLKLYILVSI